MNPGGGEIDAWMKIAARRTKMLANQASHW